MDRHVFESRLAAWQSGEMPQAPTCAEFLHAGHTLQTWERQHPRVPLPKTMPFWYREPGLWLPLSCAIAYDTSIYLGYNGSSGPLTGAHTCTGATRALIVDFIGAAVGGADDITTVTYAGAGLSFIAKRSAASGNILYKYGMVAPATGTNNVVISSTTNHLLIGGAISYTGVLQSGFPDASTTTAVVNGNTATCSLTTVLDNCWTEIGQTGNPYSQATAGAGTTFRNTNPTFYNYAILDSNGPKTPAGSTSLIVNTVSFSDIAVTMVSFAPDVAAGGQPTMRRWDGIRGMTPGGIKPGRAFTADARALFNCQEAA